MSVWGGDDVNAKLQKISFVKCFYSHLSVLRCQGDYLFCLPLVTSSSSTFYRYGTLPALPPTDKTRIAYPLQPLCFTDLHYLEMKTRDWLLFKKLILNLHVCLHTCKLNLHDSSICYSLGLLVPRICMYFFLTLKIVFRTCETLHNATSPVYY